VKIRKPHRTKHNRTAIVKGYLGGERMRTLAALHDIHECTLKRILRTSGIPMRPTGRPRNRGAADAEVQNAEGKTMTYRKDRDILMAVSAIQASCQHDPEVWQRACFDDPRDNKRHDAGREPMTAKRRSAQRVSAHRKRKLAAVRKDSARKHGDGQRRAKLALVGIRYDGFAGGLIAAAMISRGIIR
jgi:hypothetical protein